MSTRPSRLDFDAVDAVLKVPGAADDDHFDAPTPPMLSNWGTVERRRGSSPAPPGLSEGTSAAGVEPPPRMERALRARLREPECRIAIAGGSGEAEADQAVKGTRIRAGWGPVHRAQEAVASSGPAASP